MKVVIKKKLYIIIPHLMRNVLEVDLNNQEINEKVSSFYVFPTLRKK